MFLCPKVMILSHDRERGRVSLSTKKLEPTPGDMIRNPKLVFEKVSKSSFTTHGHKFNKHIFLIKLNGFRPTRWLRLSDRELLKQRQWHEPTC